MKEFWLALQVVVSIFLIGAILLQSQGSGLGAAWGGGGETYHTRRGLEKILFYLTIAGVALFITAALGVASTL
ncbi:MAG: preprotein translocase subunit SecG [Candidatus Pacebacteria bacterium RIFCSPHIGHO2_01_FULL_46_16]|nr:MAG: preprotein translocase subunit SecG [Candidatus Pacebacteria bacterium RIFCSPHIGHO2_01_FULL_46_16]OGJ21225.1 MAG: preprotein translocase subunit SecG [Candidatus Pacebacteria bacterium RIFCSPHIGHO2_02_FULL_46_9]